MRIPSKIVARAVPALVIGSVAVMVGYSNWRDSRKIPDRPTAEPFFGERGAPRTSPESLLARIKDMEARLADKPGDTGAAVLLADALMRQARVTGNGGLAVRAERALKGVLEEDPADYDALRMLGATYLSQHRFREAIASAERASRVRPEDSWNYGVLGDGHLELGEYDKAVAAFQRMMDLRPSAAAYARASYARELHGDLDGALASMVMAADATTAHDPESQAWHATHIGNLLLQMGRLPEAEGAYRRAQQFFPGHPLAIAGVSRLKTMRGEYQGALAAYRDQLQKTPTPELEARIGDMYWVLGDRAEAERHYVLAEIGWKVDTPEPTLLARFLAERNRKIDEAVNIAEQAARGRQDIFTMDALAWAYFRAGRTADAEKASKEALRTGTRDRHILYHAAAIKQATGDLEAARTLIKKALDGNPQFDPIAAPAAAAIAERISHSGQTEEQWARR